VSRELPPGPGGPHYDMTEPRHSGPHFGPKCPGCRLHTEAAEGYACWTPGCPCQGMAADSAEAAQAAAAAARRALSARTLDGAAALDTLERSAWLELAEAAGELIDVVIEHREAP
jgi:hypothetical protein